MVNTYAYDPFGKITDRQEQVGQPFTFVGQYGVMTEPNGFYYMRARYYDPQVGRFISEDPIGLDGGDVNLYAYAGNNPIMLIDPWGRCQTRDNIAAWIGVTATATSALQGLVTYGPGLQAGIPYAIVANMMANMALAGFSVYRAIYYPQEMSTAAMWRDVALAGVNVSSALLPGNMARVHLAVDPPLLAAGSTITAQSWPDRPPNQSTVNNEFRLPFGTFW
ncbi:MAG: RHS repeat-associated core domain-containing protein [Syntrophorhabdaceae bacterium]|nr:RHS repeat-associated core domain-containing protein [Syntrophorhabdaceae bacterium]